MPVYTLLHIVPNHRNDISSQPDKKQQFWQSGKKTENDWFRCEKCGDVMQKMANGKQSVCTKCGGMMKRL